MNQSMDLLHQLLFSFASSEDDKNIWTATGVGFCGKKVRSWHVSPQYAMVWMILTDVVRDRSTAKIRCALIELRLFCQRLITTVLATAGDAGVSDISIVAWLDWPVSTEPGSANSCAASKIIICPDGAPSDATNVKGPNRSPLIAPGKAKPPLVTWPLVRIARQMLARATANNFAF